MHYHCIKFPVSFMKYWVRIIRHSGIYWAISSLLVLLAMAMTAKLVNKDIEEDLNIPLVKTLGAYTAALQGGTVNSRAMGAAILFGVENQKAKQQVLGKSLPDDHEVLSALESLRTLYLAEAAFLVNKQGVIVAYSSINNTHATGINLSFRPYVNLVLQGTPSVYPAMGGSSPSRGIYLAAPVRATMHNTSAAIGAVVIKVGADKLDALLKTWTDGTAVLLSPQGVVFAASRQDWLFHMTGEVSSKRIADIRRTRQFDSVFDRQQPLSLPFTLHSPDVHIEGTRYAVRSLPLEWNDPEGDWMLAFLQRRAPWWTHWSVLGYASLVGLFVALGLFWLFSVVRNAALLKNMNSELSAEVDERKRAETQTTKSLSLLHATLESAKDAILVVDMNNTWVLHNQKFVDLWHLTDEIITGKNDRAALLFVLDQLKDPDIFLTKVQELYSTPETSSFDILQFKDGRIIERYSLPQRINGEVVGRVWSFHDVTESKRAEQQLNNLLAFNQTILDRSPTGIAVYKKSGPCIMANEAYAKTIGASVDDMLQQDFRNNPSWQRNGLLDIANQAFDTGLTVRQNIEGTTTFGKQVNLECIFAPIDISARQYLLVMTNDIADRIKAEHALKESMHQLETKELAKTRFLAAAGHDLRQPLAAANLFIDALKLTKPTAHQDQIIQRLDQTMSTFNGLLAALLDISKLDAGIIKPKYISINLVEIFDWLEQSFAPLACNKQLGFKVHFPMRESLVIHTDIDLIKSVLMNLVSNAIKYTPAGSILVSARRRGSDVLFQVWDTGIGIQKEQIEHIFDEFYQINNPQRDRTAGLGLGLAIVKRALLLLGKAITCRSQSGRGSVFEFSLPLAQPSSEVIRQDSLATMHKDEASNIDLFARGKRFVIVEDDALVAEALCQALMAVGGAVVHFYNVEDALLDTNIQHADYYIVDFMLGGTLNGIQFLNRLQDQCGQAISAVLMTGDTSPDFVRGVEESHWPVMHKPVNLSKLVACLSAQAR